MNNDDDDDSIITSICLERVRHVWRRAYIRTYACMPVAAEEKITPGDVVMMI